MLITPGMKGIVDAAFLASGVGHLKTETDLTFIVPGLRSVKRFLPCFLLRRRMQTRQTSPTAV